METRDNLVTVEVASKHLAACGLSSHDKAAALESHLLRVEESSWCTSRNTADALNENGEWIFLRSAGQCPSLLLNQRWTKLSLSNERLFLHWRDKTWKYQTIT